MDRNAFPRSSIREAAWDALCCEECSSRHMDDLLALCDGAGSIDAKSAPSDTLRRHLATEVDMLRLAVLKKIWDGIFHPLAGTDHSKFFVAPGA